jgi:hypothetical protein
MPQFGAATSLVIEFLDNNDPRRTIATGSGSGRAAGPAGANRIGKGNANLGGCHPELNRLASPAARATVYRSGPAAARAAATGICRGITPRCDSGRTSPAE